MSHDDERPDADRTINSGPRWPSNRPCPAHKTDRTSNPCDGDYGIRGHEIHTGREVVLSTCPTFKCACCLRWYPWCFGADDKQAQLCDDCASRNGQRPFTLQGLTIRQLLTGKGWG